MTKFHDVTKMTS